MRMAQRLWLIFTSGFLVSNLISAPVETLDLKPFTGPSPIEKYHVEWLMPHGRQVLDGIPFQIEGGILLYGTNTLQRDHHARTNVNNIPVDRSFEKLHLLAGSQAFTPDGISIAQIILQYADHTSASLDIVYGEHLRTWTSPWHEENPPLTGTNSRVAWRRPAAALVSSDNFLRLFHITLANPSPEKPVKFISLASTKANPGFFLVAMSTGPAAADPLPDTVAQPAAPYPDFRPRAGSLLAGSGRIATDDGQPIPAAKVRIVAARKLNTADYESTTDDPAVNLTATTDAAGHFTLPPVADNRLYRLLVAAAGFEPAYYRGLDPKSDPIELRLQPAIHLVDNTNSIHLRVLAPDGQPVPLALAAYDGVARGGSRHWGGDNDFPEQLFTDTNGEFILTRAAAFDRVQIKITTAEYAPYREWFDRSNGVQTIQLDVGARLQGRVLKNGQPLPDLRVSASATERDMEVYKGSYQARTDTNGVFRFAHLPANTSWQVFGVMDSFKSFGALPPRTFSTGAPGETNDMGDFLVVPALTLSGTVETRSGEPLPKGTKIGINISPAYDYLTVTPDKSGKFSATGLYAGQAEISLRLNGWHLSGLNRSLDLMNPFHLTGLFEKDKDDITISIEPGRVEYGGDGNFGNLPSQDYSMRTPMEGSEPSGSPMLTLAGRVVDDETGRPILRYRAIPGYQPPSPVTMAYPKTTVQKLLEPLSKPRPTRETLPFLMSSRAEQITNGNFTFQYRQLTSKPVVRIQADGYQPFTSDPTVMENTNLILRLTKGHGPSGVVLLPDGHPAENATVIFAATQEQYHLNDTNGLISYYNKDAVKTTAHDGQFNFPPRHSGQTLFAAHTAGWAEVPLEKDFDHLKIHLQPWAVITGILVTSNGAPVIGTNLQLTATRDWQRGTPGLNLENHVATDAHGAFKFIGVPPRHIEINRTIPFGPRGNGYSYKLQTSLDVEPGITNDLGKITLDTPPQPSTLDKWKQKLGL